MTPLACRRDPTPPTSPGPCSSSVLDSTAETRSAEKRDGTQIAERRSTGFGRVRDHDDQRSGFARFAAFNDDVFALETDNATSLVSPARLAADAPEVIAERDVVSDDGSESAALFTVRYVTAVTWTVAHHGLEASISAGTNGAAPNPDGPDDALPLAALTTLLSAMGLGLVMMARRRPPAVH